MQWYLSSTRHFVADDQLAYIERPLLRAHIDRIMAASSTSEYSLTVTDEKAQRKTLAEFVVEAMRIETTDQKRNKHQE